MQAWLLRGGAGGGGAGERANAHTTFAAYKYILARMTGSRSPPVVYMHVLIRTQLGAQCRASFAFLTFGILSPEPTLTGHLCTRPGAEIT